MSLLNNYLEKIDFSSYDDFSKDFKINVPQNFNFAYDIVDKLATEKSNKIAMVWCNKDGKEKTITFSELKTYSDKTANMFKNLGIKKGDPVMLILKRHYEFWFCILALHKLGAITIPATHLLTTKDIVYRNNAAGVKMIVTTAESDVSDHIIEAEKDSETLKIKMIVNGEKEGFLSYYDELSKASENFERPTGELATKNDDIMLLYFTSGTTGYPKMVIHNFTYPLAHIVTAKYWQNVTADGLHLTVSETGWAKSAWGKIYGQWICETAIFVFDFDRFVPNELLSVVSKHKVTTFCAPPTIYRFLIKDDLTKYDLSSLKYCVVAGEPLNPEVFNAFLKQTGIKLMEGFGQTETTLQLATFPFMEPKPGSMGKPNPIYDIDIINSDGTSCDVGVQGEIVLKMAENVPLGVFGGYYKDDERTSSVWYDNIYHTGDIAWKDEDGYYWFVGRNDDVIKSSGYRIGPFEVESALMEHPAVLETAITGVPDPDKGQIVKATIVLAKGYNPSDELKKELQEHVKNVTAPYKYPRIIDFVTELPKTISGKIKRFEIRNKAD